MVEESRPVWVRYSAAVVAAAAAALARELLARICHDRFPLLPFFPAVVFVTLFFGRGPGLFSLVLSAIAAWSWRWRHASPELTGWALAVPASMALLAGLLLVFICDRSRVAHHAVIAAKAAGLEASEKISAILSNITGFFFVLDRDWRFTYVTQQTAKYFGREPTDMIGKTYAELFPGAEQSEFARKYREAIVMQLPVEFEATSLANPDRWVEVRAYPSSDGLSIYFHDVTARKLIEQDRDRLLSSERHARSEAERASHLKDEFLATLSHELRTPLNAILGYAQLLRIGTVTPEVTEGLQIIERNARAQSQIIEDMLDMSRIISGKLRIDVRPMNLADAMKSALETVLPAARAKGITVDAKLDKSLGLINGDEGRMRQVAWNLLSNAIKFTPLGGHVSVGMSRDDGHIQVVVRDDGQGIRTDFLPYVFDRFRQADASTTRQHGGLGLGLSIVKNLVELHGGSVRAESEGEGKGSTFIMILPVGPELHDLTRPLADLAGAVNPSHVLDSFGLAGVRVLVVDDEQDARDLARRLLEECHAHVATAASVDEALKQFDDVRPDVLVCDIGMPGQDGYDMIRRVRGRAPELGGIVPAAALTAFAREEDRRRAMSAGYQVHIAKPVDATGFLSAVARLAGRTKQPADV